MRLFALLLLLSASALAAQATDEAQKPAQPAARKSCTVNHEPPSEAERALAREEYDHALELFLNLNKTQPELSRLGVLRVHIAQDKVADALEQARAWTAEQPQSSVAHEALSEALLRDGDIFESYKAAQRSLQLDACNPRAYLMLAAYEQLSAYYALGRKHLQTAHQLAPNDPQIREEWIGTLPRRQRLEERARQLNDTSTMSEKDHARLAESLAHANDFKPSDCGLVSSTETATIPIEKILDGPNRVEALALDVYFNGKRRRLEIDTGASGFLLTRGSASALGLTREIKTETGGIGDKGRVASSVSHVASIKIGAVEFSNCPVRILESRSSLDIDGLIGGDVFRHFLLSIDFPKSQLRLAQLPARPEVSANPSTLQQHPLPSAPAGQPAEEKEDEAQDRYVAPEMKSWTSMYRRGHDIMLPVGLGEERFRIFIVDTGSSTMLVSPDAAKHVTKVHGNSDVQIHGISGRVDRVYETGKFTFRFANLRQTIDNMTALDTTKISHDVGIEISGFLGAPILQRLTIHIDYRDNLIKFDYDPKN